MTRGCRVVPASTRLPNMETWKWVTGPIRYSDLCDRCFTRLRNDSQVVERHLLRYHLPCFLDYAVAQMNATLLRNADDKG